jgi:hypothetical protein
MPSLVAVLQHDAPFDTEIAKAALETLMQLCEVAEKVRRRVPQSKSVLTAPDPANERRPWLEVHGSLPRGQLRMLRTMASQLT